MKVFKMIHCSLIVGGHSKERFDKSILFIGRTNSGYD